jgi:hypothetical protein
VDGEVKAAGGGGVSSSRSKLGESSKALEKELAEIYVCPISLELMSDPVMAADGKERRAVRTDIMLRSLPILHALLANTLSTLLVTSPLHLLCSLVSSCLVCSVVALCAYHESSGHTYERSAIAAWFAAGKRTSPKTNLELDHLYLIPNHTLRQLIEAHKQRVSSY